MFMPNLIKVLLPGTVLDFETCRGTYRSVETNYQGDGQTELTVN
jgi:phage-related protein